MTPLETAREAFFELDDIIGRLNSAICVMDMLTENTPQNLGTITLHDRHRELETTLRAAWPIVVKGEESPRDDIFHEGASVFINGKAFVLGKHHDAVGWELHHGGEHVMTCNRRHLLKIIEGIKFKETAA